MINRNEEAAFPVPIGQTDERQWGMSLRDWFIGQAIQGLLEPDDVFYLEKNPKRLAGVVSVARQIADAMMEAREAKQ